jgi:polyisoprenoid-binding protein YceI
VGDENKGMIRRLGFEASTRLNRQDYGVSWQDEIPGGGIAAGNELDIALDLEAIHLGKLEETKRPYYR